MLASELCELMWWWCSGGELMWWWCSGGELMCGGVVGMQVRS